MEVSGQLHVRAVLPPAQGPRYPLNSRVNGPQSLYDHFFSYGTPTRCRVLPLRGFAITLNGHTTLGRTPLDE